jgi:hypothetical protein
MGTGMVGNEEVAVDGGSVRGRNEPFMSMAKNDEERPADNGATPAPAPDVEVLVGLAPTFAEATNEEAAADMADALATWLPEPLVCMGS